MKRILTALTLLLVVVFSCKEKNKEVIIDHKITSNQITTSIYPTAVTKIFDAHGGIDAWNTMRTLSFTMDKANVNEVTTTDLKTRHELIDTPKFTLGYDGKTLWVNEKNENAYVGNAQFYKGLMMYFYAMPFIVGDNGVKYENTEPLTFEGKTYPGILISFESGIGVSPKDEYIIYYNAETGQMEWLAYTVTFFQKEEKLKEFKYIRYNNWQTINGLLLPKSIDWYNYENNLPTDKLNTVEFTDVILSEKPTNKSVFFKPETAKIIE